MTEPDKSCLKSTSTKTQEEVTLSTGRVIKRPRREFGEWESEVSPRRTSSRRLAAKKTQDASNLKPTERPTRKRANGSNLLVDKSEETVGEKEADDSAKTSSKAPRKKLDRPNWTAHDIDMFYKAITEHGRDWKHLHTYIKRHRHQKGKKGEFERNQEDVRQFYYRSWHKISKYITAPEGLDKQVLELFSLVCYGAMRKKLGNSVDEKVGQKLNEFVLKGSTHIRYKRGKKTFSDTVRVPACPTVKKIFNLEGLQFEKKTNNAVRLPEFIKLELKPKTNAAWWEVQSLAQNPRLRTKLKPNQHMGQVLLHLNKKWKPNRLRTKEQLNEGSEHVLRELRLTPPDGCGLQRWDLSRVYTSKGHHKAQTYHGVEEFLQNVKSLNLGDKKQCGLSRCSRRITLKPAPTPAPSIASSDTAVDGKESVVVSPSEVTEQDPLFNFKLAATTLLASTGEPADKNIVTRPPLMLFGREVTEDIALETACDFPSLDGAKKESASTKSDTDSISVQTSVMATSPIKDSAILSPASSCKDSSETSPGGKPSPLSKQCSLEGDMPPGSVPPPDEIADAVSMNEKIDNVRGGLTAGNADQVTAAELYLMMDRAPEEGRVLLEYEWVDIVPDPVPDILDLSSASNSMRRLVHLGATDLAMEMASRHMASPPRIETGSGPVCCQCGGTQETTTTTTPKGRGRGSRRGTPKQSSKIKADLENPPRSEELPSINVQVSEVAQAAPANSQVHTPSSSTGPTPTSAAGPPRALVQPPNVFKVPNPPIPNARPVKMQQILPRQMTTPSENVVNRIIMMPRRPRQRRLPKPVLMQRSLLPKPSDHQGPRTFVMSPNGTLVVHSSEPVTQMTQSDVYEGVQVKAVCPQVPASSEGSSTDLLLKNEDESSQNVHTSQFQSMPDLTQLFTSVQQGAETAVSTSHMTSLLRTGPTLMTSLLDDQSSLSSMDNALQSLITNTAPITQGSLLDEVRSAAQGHKQAIQVTTTLPGGMVASGLVTDDSLGPTLALPSMSGLLDISLPSLQAEEGGGENEKLFDLPLSSNGMQFVSTLLQPGSATVSSPVQIDTSVVATSSEALSPSKFLRIPSGLVGEDSSMGWLGSGEDFHLSNFLESPIKSRSTDPVNHPVSSLSFDTLTGNSQSIFNIGESSRDSLKSTFDVAAALNTVLAENSLDCFNRFETGNLELPTADLQPPAK